jgi:hypothetical protein
MSREIAKDMDDAVEEECDADFSIGQRITFALRSAQSAEGCWPGVGRARVGVLLCAVEPETTIPSHFSAPSAFEKATAIFCTDLPLTLYAFVSKNATRRG